MARCGQTALEDRDAQAYAGIGCCFGLRHAGQIAAQRAQIIGVIAAGKNRHTRGSSRSRHLAVETRGYGAFLVADQVGIVGQRHIDRCFHVSGDARKVGGCLQILRRLAHQPNVCFARGDQIGLDAAQLALRQRKPRLRLGDVGPRKVADLEPVAGRLRVDRQHFDLIAREGHQRLAAKHVHIGGDDLAEDRTFGCTQIGLSGRNALLRCLQGVLDGATRIDRYF